MFKTVHMTVTFIRAARIVKALQNEYNFDIRYDGPTQQTVIDFVIQRRLSNRQIINEIMEMHTINLNDLALT